MSRIQTVRDNDGNILHVRDAEFKCGTEEWSEYYLDDGTIVRVKVIVQRILRIVEADGKQKYLENGEPSLRISHVTQVITRPPRVLG